MGKDANTLRKQVLTVAAHHPRVGRLVASNAGRMRMRHGGWFWAMPEGWPDLTGWLVGGRMLLVEIKTETDYYTNAQREAIEKATADGVLVLEVRQVSDFVKGLEEQ